MTLKILLVILLLIVIDILGGCSLGLYVRIGPQKAKKVSLVIDGQESDPNIPKGLISVGLLK